jgi:predicted molibdopterin-dependent oxidoreductase YjgC
MGIAPASGGKSFVEIVAAAKAGDVKALILHADNPLLTAPGTADITAALANLQALVVIDSIRSTAAEFATVVLPETAFFAKDGSTTNADLHVFRHNPAPKPGSTAQPGLAVLTIFANALGASIALTSTAEVTDAIAGTVAGYPTRAALAGAPGATRVAADASRAVSQPVAAAPARAGQMAVITGRSLYTSWEGASMRSEEADKLHRDEAAWLNPQDAQDAGIRSDDVIELVGADGQTVVRIAARLDDGVRAGTVYVPQYFDGGAVMALYPLEGQAAGVASVRVRALQPA